MEPKGRRLPKLTEVLANPATVWTKMTVTDWYGGETRVLDIATGTAVWYHAGLPPAPIRWVLVCDPADQREPQAFLSTRLDDTPAEILTTFVSRWRVETTFQEVRRHLGVETQRQWSDLAILRTTPVLLGLFSLVTLWGTQIAAEPRTLLRPCRTAWYDKAEPTFSDAIAAVRRALWSRRIYQCPGQGWRPSKLPPRCCTACCKPRATPRDDSGNCAAGGVPGRADAGMNGGKPS